MERVRREQNNRICRYLAIAQSDRLRVLAVKDVEGGILAKYLVKELTDVGQAIEIFRSCRAALQHLVDLFDSPGVYFRVADQIAPQKAQGVGGRLVTRYQERDDLVSDLPVGHLQLTHALFLKSQKPVDHIVGGIVASLVPFDDLVNQLIEFGNCLLVSQMVRGGKRERDR